jgi:hypothetical protein
MTLLQTRVDDRVARRFEQAAKAQGKSPYALLAHLVEKTAEAQAGPGWDQHRAGMPKRSPLPINACVQAQTRADEDR